MNLFLGFLVCRAFPFSVEFSPSLSARAMPEEEAQAAGSGGTYGNATLPWNQIPSFEPRVTDMGVYSRKLSFLRHIWPAESVEHLAPRAALLVNGTAFQKVAWTQPSSRPRMASSSYDPPEGLRFRRQLETRELARKAFVQAGNDSAFRRALLHRSCPGMISFEPADWTLYWCGLYG